MKHHISPNPSLNNLLSHLLLLQLKHVKLSDKTAAWFLLHYLSFSKRICSHLCSTVPCFWNWKKKKAIFFKEWFFPFHGWEKWDITQLCWIHTAGRAGPGNQLCKTAGPWKASFRYLKDRKWALGLQVQNGRVQHSAEDNSFVTSLWKKRPTGKKRKQISPKAGVQVGVVGQERSRLQMALFPPVSPFPLGGPGRAGQNYLVAKKKWKHQEDCPWQETV